MAEENRDIHQDSKNIIYNLAKECKGDGPNERVDAFLEKYESFKNNFNDEITKIRNALIGDNKSALLALISGSNNPLVDSFLRRYVPEGRFKEELNKVKDIFAPVEKYGIATKMLGEDNANKCMDIFASSVKKNLETLGQSKSPDEDNRFGIINTLDEEVDKIRKTLEGEKNDVLIRLRKSLL